MERYHGKVKTQRYTFGGKNPGFYSQGLLMHPNDFGWEIYETYNAVKDNNNYVHFVNNETRFLTETLGVTYAEASDNKRKAASSDKYKKMAQRYPKLFSKKPIRWLMKHTWGKKLLFVFFGRKKDKRNGWPSWIKKTDEERIQNATYFLQNKEPWVATEKLDGTSTTFAMKRGHGLHKNELYICSRNVVFDKPDKQCFYATNVYTEMAQKYNVEEVLTNLLKEFPQVEWIVIQGETYGEGIQKRDYSLKGHDFKAFNLVMSNTGRLGTVEMTKILTKYNIPCVPIVNTNFILPNTVEELLTYATGDSVIDGKSREGFVFRSLDGSLSFKAVSNEYLIKFHG